jgi:two-component system sensor histidine kinase KdpD
LSDQQGCLEGKAMDVVSSWSAGRRYALSIGGVALASLILAQLSAALQVANIAVLYLLVVLLIATTIGMGPALLASVLAFLGFNYFFVEPLHSFQVNTAQDNLRLLTFLVVAVIGSSLAGRAREQANAAARSAQELAALYDFSQALSAEVELERILPLVAQTVTKLLNVPACSVLLYDSGGRLAERAAAGVAGPEPQRRIDAFLRIGPRVLGALRVTQRALDDPLTADEQSRLETIAAQVGLVLERAQLVEQASHSRAQADAERMKATLLSSVSHDLRTPLAVIKGAVTSLMDESVAWQPEPRRELLLSINDESDRLNRLVGNLLDMSRIEGQAPHPPRSPQDIGALIEDVAERLRRQIGSHPIEINLPAELPLAQANYTQIDQVLTNLIENAARYTPAGTPIVVRAYAERDTLAVEVRDHGPGIPEGMRARIFEKFVRAVGPERHADGAGLGLAICNGILKAHGGQIWAENAADGGARFIFTLPLATSSTIGLHSSASLLLDHQQAEGAV